MSWARRKTISAAWLVVAVAFMCAAPGVHAASTEPKPLEITEFKIQTTGPTELLPLHGKQNGENETYELVNKPVAFTQAGGHPWGLTTTFEFASELVQHKFTGEIREYLVPTADPKDVIVAIPPGLVGNPTAVPRCPLTVALAFPKEVCPPSTQVGEVHLLSNETELLAPIVNVAPETGQSAEFAIEPGEKIPFVVTGHLVRTPEGYGIAVASNNTPGLFVRRFEVTFWGVPADPSHDAMRGLTCTGKTLTDCHGGNHSSGVPEVPFLTLGSQCSAGRQSASMLADSWETPGSVGFNGQYTGAWKKAETTLPGLTGCEKLDFAPKIEVQPDTTTADEPVGVGVKVKVPQFEEPRRLGTPDLRDATVTMPLGMSVSPGVVDGIEACEATGPRGIDIEGPESEVIGPSGQLQLAPGHCPDASTVGTAEAITPLLPEPVKGHVYLAKPECGGPGESACTEADAVDGRLYKVYLELGGAGVFGNAGIEIKVEGKVQVDPATGQITTRFLSNPQTPFSELIIHLNGGPRASLANPAVCGPAVTTSDFKPWSAPGITPEGLTVAGTPDATPQSEYTVVGCGNPPGLHPEFLAGTVTPNAGKFSAFTLDLSRQDREQFIKGIQVHTPPGLSGVLAKVPLCGEQQADEGTCPAASKIGTTRVASGAGSHPFELEGDIFLTGPYRGAPFGLSIVVHLDAGPFHLGIKVVRARIAVDPVQATLTVTTDETGPYAVPQIVFGVPVRLRRVTVNIDRPGFMFNPTNCSEHEIRAIVSGAQQAIASVATPFAVGQCKSLVFKPKFTVSTSGHTSRRIGASLDAKVSYPAGSMGSAANIARVKVSLPRQLPSRLTTLQQACPAAKFNANPATCPSASIVGIARSVTPVLPVKLEGPAYFVSHGGEAFPSLIVVLQGDGVRVDLTGSTFISKSRITSSTFKTVPDVPVSSFELYLPEGKFSALASPSQLCKLQGKLKMPSEFVAQNGAVFKQSTSIQVTGCKSGARKAARAARRVHARKGRAR